MDGWMDGWMDLMRLSRNGRVQFFFIFMLKKKRINIKMPTYLKENASYARGGPDVNSNSSLGPPYQRCRLDANNKSYDGDRRQQCDKIFDHVKSCKSCTATLFTKENFMGFGGPIVSETASLESASADTSSSTLVIMWVTIAWLIVTVLIGVKRIYRR